ncbi:hypothetical protein BZA70DRAFT_270654 [Myxozyma melibiosi]|uniref:Cytochrome c oxidase polypeptide VIIA n=1 Tax=Myxozyma melibiosi TaxID=54550 RepID=A0ABR1FBD9_9ASCO
MAIPPITGMLKRAVIRDITIALSLGFVGGSYYWNHMNLPYIQRREEGQRKLEAIQSSPYPELHFTKEQLERQAALFKFPE